MLLIPGTGSVAHLRENLAAEGVTLDDEALRELDGVGAWLGRQQVAPYNLVERDLGRPAALRQAEPVASAQSEYHVVAVLGHGRPRLSSALRIRYWTVFLCSIEPFGG